MKSKPCLMLIAAMSLAASCASPGDFCDVSSPAYIGSDAVADYIHSNDPALEEFLIVHNRTGEAMCAWKFR